MHKPTSALRSITSSTIAILIAMFFLAGCGSDKPKKEEKKDDRSPQERVLLLKQRFEQLESSLDDMKRDLEIHKKRIESTQKIVDSIKHSLTKGGLKGYSISNISTTDPLVLEAIAQRQDNKKDKERREAEKEEADNATLNALLIACFLAFIIAIFVTALKDKKNPEPLEPAAEPWTPEPEPPGSADDDSTIDLTDTGAYEYGELRPPHETNDDTPETPPNTDKPEDQQ